MQMDASVQALLQLGSNQVQFLPSVVKFSAAVASHTVQYRWIS
jgi:hypothetical protein